MPGAKARMKKRNLYSWIVALHPPKFRKRFGDEMLCIFDEANDGGSMALFKDGVASVMRQWLLRSGAWKVMAAVAGAVAQMALFGSAWSGMVPRAIVRVPAAAERGAGQGLALLLVAGITTAILMSGVAVATWNGTSLMRRQGRAAHRRRL